MSIGDVASNVGKGLFAGLAGTAAMTVSSTLEMKLSGRGASQTPAQGSEAVLEACEAEGIAFIPWFPLASGSLSQPGGPVDEIAANHEATPGQIALAWLLRHSPVMLPIPGTSSAEHLEENVAAVSIELTDDEYTELSEVSG